PSPSTQNRMAASMSAVGRAMRRCAAGSAVMNPGYFRLPARRRGGTRLPRGNRASYFSRSATTQQPGVLRVLFEPLRDVPTDGVHLPIAATVDVCDSAVHDPRSVALSPEIRHCESSGERDGLPVVSIVEHTDEHAIAHERVARSVLLVSENEAVDDRGIGHSSTLGHRDTQRLVLTR